MVSIHWKQDEAPALAAHRSLRNEFEAAPPKQAPKQRGLHNTAGASGVKKCKEGACMHLVRG